MHPRARELIDQLGLQPHPEGGYYARLYRANTLVRPEDGRPPRIALSAIHFLLLAGQCSRWHRLRSDEVWTWIEGAPLVLRSFAEAEGVSSETLLGAAARGVRPVAAVGAGLWQCAEPLDDYTLCSCCVAPGFEFSDFAFLADAPEALARLRACRPDWQRWL